MNYPQGTKNSGQACPKNVAIVYPFFALYRQPVITELLKSSSFRFEFFADDSDHKTGIKCIDLSNEPSFRKAPIVDLPFGLTWQTGILRLSLTQRYHAVIFLADASSISTWMTALICRLRGKDVLFWTHGWTRRDSWVRGIVKATFFRLANKLLLYGEHAKAVGEQAGFPRDRMHVIFNSLDFDYQTKLFENQDDAQVQLTRINYFREYTTPVAIAVGRLTVSKRFNLLIEAIGILKRRGHPVNALLVGDGPMKDDLVKLAESQQVSVAFIGSCFNEEHLCTLFMAANVTVSPGNIGLMCMHSLGYGTPVITHDDSMDQMPEFEAIQPGLNGDLFSKSSVDSLAQTIFHWTQQSNIQRSVRIHCRDSIKHQYHARNQAILIEQALAQ